MHPYRVPSYPDKEPTIKEPFSIKWAKFYERTSHIRSEKWPLMFFGFCTIYTLLAGFVYSLISRQYMLQGSWMFGILYVAVVMLYFATAIGLVIFMVKIALNKI